MVKELQQLLAQKEKELLVITGEIKGLKTSIAKLQSKQSKQQHPNHKPNVGIGYDLSTNSIFVKVHNSKVVEHICYLDTVNKVVEKAMAKYPKDKYALTVMEASFEQGLSKDYSQKLIQEIKMAKKVK